MPGCANNGDLSTRAWAGWRYANWDTVISLRNMRARLRNRTLLFAGDSFSLGLHESMLAMLNLKATVTEPLVADLKISPFHATCTRTGSARFCFASLARKNPESNEPPAHRHVRRGGAAQSVERDACALMPRH